MIYFITKRLHQVSHTEITTVDNFDAFHKFISTLNEIGFDKEFNGLNELYSIPLLTVVGNEEHQFVIDDTSFPQLSYLEPYKEKLFVGHNIKIDIKIARLQGIDIRRVYDTMIVEQRLGLDSKRLNALDSVYERRVKKPFPVFAEGDVREEFKIMNSRSVFENRHIRYGASDIATLFPIKKDQKRLIEKFDYNLLVNKIENQLIPIIADGELEGFTLDEDKWRKLLSDNKSGLLKVERELDAELTRLGARKDSYRKERQTVDVVQTSMFADVEEKITKNKNLGRINYSSSPQVLAIFDNLGLPRPTDTKKEKDKITGKKTYEEIDSIGEDALQKYMIEHRDSIIIPFILKLLDHKELSKEISSFGERFLRYEINVGGKKKLGYKNRKTNKIHTIYRQCMTSTGRFASGEEANGFYNSQQVPAKSSFRNCFTLTQEEIDNDWWITTCDLTGAEVVIMCAFAKDKDLYKWAVEEDDLHSPMATKCWRAVYEYRKLKKRSLTIKSLSESKVTHKKEVIELSADIIINKKTNAAFRDDFKAVTFATIYRAKADTIGSTINIPKDEAQIVIDTIKATIPATFKMVQEAIDFAVHNGYVVHNKRTNSRKYFHQSFKGWLSKEEQTLIEGQASNCRIQGTQADLLKEAMVKIWYYFMKNNIENCFLLQVHDELVWKHKGKENGQHIERIMSETATKYLEGFTAMKADAQTLHYWNK